jgi:hypothetical protein
MNIKKLSLDIWYDGRKWYADAPIRLNMVPFDISPLCETLGFYKFGKLCWIVSMVGNYYADLSEFDEKMAIYHIKYLSSTELKTATHIVKEQYNKRIAYIHATRNKKKTSPFRKQRK